MAEQKSRTTMESVIVPVRAVRVLNALHAFANLSEDYFESNDEYSKEPSNRHLQSVGYGSPYEHARKLVKKFSDHDRREK